MSVPPPRLKDSGTPVGDALKKVRRPASAPGARDRVWRRIASVTPPARRWIWMLTGASLAAAAAVVIAFFATREVRAPAPVLAPVAVKSAPELRVVFAASNTTVRAEEGTEAVLLGVSEGKARIRLTAGKLHVRVGAASPAVEIVGATESATLAQGFASVSADHDGLLAVLTEEGEVHLREANRGVKPNELWKEQARVALVQPAPIAEVVRPVERTKHKAVKSPVIEEQQVVTPEPVVDEAKPLRDALELARKNPAEGAAALSALGSSGAQAELALYELGRLQLRRLQQPANAAATFREHARRFPRGTLAPDVQLSLAESQLTVGHHQEALAALDAFVALAGSSERAEEVAFLRGNILRADGQCAKALALLSPIAEGQGVRAEKALYLVADCQASLGQSEEARATLRRYLDRYPQGSWRDSAARALGQER